MAVKYTIPYRSIDDTVWRVDILHAAWTSAPINVRGSGDNACTIEYDGGVDDPFDNPIVSSKANIHLINQGEIDMDELQGASDKDFVVEVYRENVLKWKGYLVTDNIQQPLTPTPYVVQLSAIDGLNMLEGITFSINNLPAPSGGAIRCPLNWLRQVLFANRNLGIMLPIRWYIGLENVATDDDPLAGLMTWSPYGDGIIAGHYVDEGGNQVAIYQNCLYILEGLVKCMKGARIFQADGAWNIFPPIDIINGSFTYSECNATLSTPTISQHTVDINRLVTGSKEPGGDYSFIREDALITVKPELNRVDVLYEADRTENILPNGGFDQYSSGVLMHWGFTPNPNTSPELPTEYESLTGQGGKAVELTNDGSATEDAEFTFIGGLPLDANLLFKRMTFGFTIMPTKYGFPYNENEKIDWTNNPLKISVGYTLNEEDPEYYLNEFGYWQNAARGTDLGVQFLKRVTEYVPPPNTAYVHRMYFTGSPNIGDTLRLKISASASDPLTDYDFTVTPTEEGSLVLALNGLMDAISSSPTVARSVVMVNPNEGYVRFNQPATVFTPPSPKGETFKSGSTNEYQYIYPRIDDLPINFAAAVVFQGKGGNNEILVPDPGQLTGAQPNLVGKLTVKFYVRPGQQYILDEAWVRVEENNDVYRASVGTQGNSQSITLGISSSFSGFMVSNLMRSYHQSNTDFIWTDGVTAASLTEHYARAVMRWRYKPSRIFNGTINTRTKDWSFLEIFEFNSITGGKFLPLRAAYNTELCEVSLVAMEGRDDGEITDVKHYASNNMPLSNYGGD